MAKRKKRAGEILATTSEKIGGNLLEIVLRKSDNFLDACKPHYPHCSQKWSRCRKLSSDFLVVVVWRK